jgi:hypothetical protein
MLPNYALFTLDLPLFFTALLLLGVRLPVLWTCFSLTRITGSWSAGAASVP